MGDAVKTCRTCGETKDASAFRGRRTECRKCETYAKHLWRQANRELRNTYERERLAKHANEVNARRRAWRKENPELAKERRNREYKRRPEPIKERVKKWREANAERVREYNKIRYAKNREEDLAKYKAWRLANPDKIREMHARRRALKKKAEGSHTDAEWQSVIARFAGCCVCCGHFFGPEKLTKDHVVPLTKGGSNFIDNIQPLCHPCNSRKNDHHSTDYRLTWNAAPEDAA